MKTLYKNIKLTFNRFINFLKNFKRTGVDRTLYFCIFILAIFGIYMIGDASVGMAATRSELYASTNMIKQFIFVLLGLGGMFFFARVFKKRWLSFEKGIIFYVICALLMFICRLWTINNAHAWINLGFVTIQPAEFMKIALILLMSYVMGDLLSAFNAPRRLSKASREILYKRRLNICLICPMVAVGIACIICGFVQNDLGSAIIIYLIALFVLLSSSSRFYAGIKKLLATLTIVGIVSIQFIVSFGILKSHQVQRFVTYLDPLNEKYIHGSSYQIVNGLVGYVDGGLLGKGAGNSVMKYGYIPEAQNDFISAIIAEEFGLLGISLVILFYAIIIYKLFHYAFKIKDTTERLILIGVASYFFSHLLINVGGVSGLIPMTGVPLLLISAGGTSTVTALCSIGIAQAIISKYNRNKAKEKAEASL